MSYSVIPYSDDYKSFLSECIRYSSCMSFGQAFGYPRFETYDEIVSELSIYDCDVYHSLFLICNNEEVIAFSGYIVDESDKSIIAFGPYCEPQYYCDKIIEVSLNNIFRKNERLLVVKVFSTPENEIFNALKLRFPIIPKDTHIEMSFDMAHNINIDIPSSISQAFYIEVKSKENITGELIESVSDLCRCIFSWDDPTNTIEELLSVGSTIFLVAFEGKYISVGIIHVPMNTNFARIEYLGVMPEYRNKGIGTFAVLQMLSFIRYHHLNVEKVYLSYNASNKNIGDIYTRIGFTYETKMTENIINMDNINFVYNIISPNLYKFSVDIPTPAIIYDLDKLDKIIALYNAYFGIIERFQIHFAIKACYNSDVLSTLAKRLHGCDVASVCEFAHAKAAGFSNITTTAPYYSIKDIRYLYEHNVIIDYNSLDQIKLHCEATTSKDIGIRVYIPLPSTMENDATFGVSSRFGIHIVDNELLQLINTESLKIRRLHVHTGQTTKESFEYKLQYLLSIAKVIPTVDTIIIGGGLFYFYIGGNEVEFLIKMNKLLRNWEEINGRNIEIIVEPGGAIVTPIGYLVTKVISSEVKNNRYLLTVDSSAWNLAPWTLPRVKNCSEFDTSVYEDVIIAGCSLYERDYFGRSSETGPQLFKVNRETKAGDRLIMASFGGYTVTNARSFNGIDIPAEYTIEEGKLNMCDGVRPKI